MSKERWRWVVGYEGLYLVSDLGRVFSIPRETTSGGLVTPVVRNGYQIVCLSRHGETVKRQVHRIELEAFIGLPKDGYQANHIDGNRSNNRLDNLEWVTQQENIEHELYVLGNIYPRQKLTQEDVRAIRTSLKSNRELAQEYGVSYSTIQNARTGKSYRKVK